ncbi:MAG: hypothetical protein ACRERX_21240 [Pseudomonas sp.]
MTTRRVFRRLKQLPDDVSEREVRRVMLVAMLPRLIIGALALVAWTWIRLKFIELELRGLRLRVGRAGTVLILIAVIYPLLRIWRMDDAEFDRELGYVE